MSKKKDRSVKQICATKLENACAFGSCPFHKSVAKRYAARIATSGSESVVIRERLRLVSPARSPAGATWSRAVSIGAGQPAVAPRPHSQLRNLSRRRPSSSQVVARSWRRESKRVAVTHESAMCRCAKCTASLVSSNESSLAGKVRCADCSLYHIP